jgi:hypothetical protein
MAEAPELRHLAGLAGLGQPPRLAKACETAGSTLKLCAQLK